MRERELPEGQVSPPELQLRGEAFSGNAAPSESGAATIIQHSPSPPQNRDRRRATTSSHSAKMAQFLTAIDMDRWWWSPDAILSLYPQWFGSVAPKSDGLWHACGFPLDVNSTSQLESLKSIAFEDAPSKRPIFFTPGTAHRHAKKFFEMAIEVCLSLEMPAILATSHSDQLPSRLPSTIRGVGYVPLDQILPHCSAIVHHGGIGTTAQAIASACPQIILPMAFDQFHNGQRVQQLGLGKAITRPSKRSLCVALTAFIRDPDQSLRCQSTAQMIQGPDGAEVAAEKIIECFRNHVD